MNKSVVEQFAQSLAGKSLSQAKIAVGLIWLADANNSGIYLSATTLARQLEQFRLSGNVNASRLARQLSEERELVIRKKDSTEFALRRPRSDSVYKVYRDSLGEPEPITYPSTIFDLADFGTRGRLRSIANQAHGCFERGFYDGCAVLSRRVIELLLIEALENSNASSAIIGHDGEYVGLGALIGFAQSGQFIKLSRNERDALDHVKQIGDLAAHSGYLTKRLDIESKALHVRVVVARLASVKSSSGEAAGSVKEKAES